MAKAIPVGPEPFLISHKEVETLYGILDAVTKALKQLQVPYIVTGGSLLGAIRQHSILFCDDDIDIAIIDETDNLSVYQKVSEQLQGILGHEYHYVIKPWEGGDKVRHARRNSVFLDLFVLRKYNNLQELKDVIGIKKNGQPQSEEYVQNILTTIQRAAFSRHEFDALFPLWHFNTRKAIEMWPKEVYRPSELFPLVTDLRFGPMVDICGPRMPILLLQRAFGLDCFHVYYQSKSHNHGTKSRMQQKSTCVHVETDSSPVDLNDITTQETCEKVFKPLVQDGGTWEGGIKMPLEDEHYIPLQPLSRAKRRHSFHNKERLMDYIQRQSKMENLWQMGHETESIKTSRPRRTIYMDGVFDLFHIGHLNAINECAKLGDKVIIGVTGQEDATSYKRAPIIPEAERVAIVSALKEVDCVVCPCPLVVTKDFMEEYGIDLVVHGFASDQDETSQYKFFEYPIQCNKFQRIPYYHKTSTTDIINRIKHHIV
jgi:cytidyltransferase-related domain